MMRPYRNLPLLLFLLFCKITYGQQDITFHLNSELLNGKTILKVKRDFNDPYLWVLAKNNEVYRVNSLTLAVDNYTVEFSAYNALQFIDIAGRSQDTVFIATNSTNVVQYIRGTTRLIGTADGIPGIVNSVGIAEGIKFQYPRQPPSLMIATNKGFRLYDMDGEKIYNQADDGDSKVYEATYRTEFYKDSSAQTSDFITQDTIQYQPVTFLPADGSIDVEFLWEGGNEFGYNINTAISVYESIDLYDPVFTNLFWGNSRGMFQNYSDQSFHSIYVQGGHYLDGINVNKITTIYGLSSFGTGEPYDPNALIKQNLLVGTDVGLYFSSSIYTSSPSLLRQFSLFHYDELGSVRVNDICVNLQLPTLSNCEDGVWVACDNGLYLLKPDYSKAVNGQQFHAASFKNHPDTVSSIKICTGMSAVAIINTSEYTGKTIQWYKNGQELPGQSLDSLAINSSGEYYAALYDPCENAHLETNHLIAQVVNAPVFTFNYPDKLLYCAGTQVLLTAHGNGDYQYRWYFNGTLNGNTLPTQDITQSGKYKVEVSACENSWVPSKEVEIDLIAIPVPAITADKTSYCIGDNATLSIALATDAAYTINWYRDNILISSNSNQTSLNTNTSGNYAVVITSNEANTDGTVCTQASAIKNITFNPLPTVSIQQIIKTTLCDGQTVDLKVSFDDGNINWSTGQTGDQITVGSSGKYSATVTSEAGCISDATINVQFFPNPVLDLANMGVCVASHKTATLTAPAGMTSYIWNGQPGEQSYIADHPQTVTLTVVDANGCTATQDIKIADECPDIVIPNAFTPNGDGVNDTWNIKGLEYDATALVRVFTRYGQQVFESKSYPKPWDGTLKAKQLPPGVYYYIINAKNGTQTYSGSLMIIY